MRRTSCLAIVTLLAVCCGGLPGAVPGAEGASLQWRRSYGRVDLPVPVTVSPDGRHVYLGGRTLRKVDAATGKVVWSRDFNSRAVQATAGGAVYAAGVNGIARFDCRGAREWARSGYYSGVATDAGESAVYAVGRSATGVIYSMQLRKLTPAGRILWLRNFKRAGWSRAEGVAVAVDRGGSVCVALSAQSPSENTYHLARYRPSGARDWIQASAHNRAITIGRDGNLYAAAGTFEPETCYTGHIAKYRPSDGTRLWTKADRACGSDYLDVTASRVDGSLYVAGWHAGRVLLRQFSTAGRVLWTSTFGSGGFGLGVAAASDSSLYLSAMIAGNLTLSKYR